MVASPLMPPNLRASKPTEPAVNWQLVAEGLSYFDRIGDAGDRVYVTAIREALKPLVRDAFERHTLATRGYAPTRCTSGPYFEQADRDLWCEWCESLGVTL